MSRKDYIRLAEVVVKARERGDGVEHLIDALCSALLEDNPKFDRARFRAACNRKHHEN